MLWLLFRNLYLCSLKRFSSFSTKKNIFADQKYIIAATLSAKILPSYSVYYQFQNWKFCNSAAVLLLTEQKQLKQEKTGYKTKQEMSKENKGEFEEEEKEEEHIGTKRESTYTEVHAKGAVANYAFLIDDFTSADHQCCWLGSQLEVRFAFPFFFRRKNWQKESIIWLVPTNCPTDSITDICAHHSLLQRTQN